MTFLNKLLWYIANICIIIWYYSQELFKRWKLRESAFRAAGDEAGRRGLANDLQKVPFLVQSKHVLEMMGACWSSRKSLTIRRLEALKDRYRQELAQHEVYDLADIMSRCKRRFGYVPRFNPLETEIFWAALLGGGVIEFFLNSSALETAGQGEDLTRFLAVIVSLAFVFGVDLLGRHKAQGKPIQFPALLLTGLIVVITLVRENAVVGYMKHIQESVPELAAQNADPRVYVLLFCGVQVLFFYIAFHWSVQHYNPLLTELHHARMDDRRRRSLVATLEALDRDLDDKAIEYLTEWDDIQRLFDHRVMVWIEAAEFHRCEGHMAFTRLRLDDPHVVTWSRVRLGGSVPPPALLPMRGRESENEKESVK